MPLREYLINLAWYGDSTAGISVGFAYNNCSVSPSTFANSSSGFIANTSTTSATYVVV